jgi:hypothetical protein
MNSYAADVLAIFDMTLPVIRLNRPFFSSSWGLSEITTAPRFHSGIYYCMLSIASLLSSYSFISLAYSFLFSILISDECFSLGNVSCQTSLI